MQTSRMKRRCSLPVSEGDTLSPKDTDFLGIGKSKKKILYNNFDHCVKSGFA